MQNPRCGFFAGNGRLTKRCFRNRTSIYDIRKIFRFFYPLPALVRIFNSYILQNSRNLPYYICFSIAASPSDADIISRCSRRAKSLARLHENTNPRGRNQLLERLSRAFMKLRNAGLVVAEEEGPALGRVAWAALLGSFQI